MQTVEKVQRQDREPNQWESYQGYDANNPQVGWYWSDFAYANLAFLYYNYAGGGGKILQFDIYSRWYNHILYVEDGLNGGQLISFLGDESDIDEIDYRPTVDFSITEEDTTMPTGEPAKVFTAQFNSSVDGIGRLTAEDLAHTVWFFAKDYPLMDLLESLCCVL